MEEVILSDAYQKLREEIEELQRVLAALTAERDDLQYHVCPELRARYAREIGDYENRINYQKMMILETKRRIEIMRAALNREKSVSKEDVDGQIHREYGTFREKVDEAFRKAEQAKWEQRTRWGRQRRYQRAWQERYGGRYAGTAGKGTSYDRGTFPGGSDRKDSENGRKDQSDEKRDRSGTGGTENDFHEKPGEREDAAQNREEMPDAKDMYRRIMKKLHPDMNPDITEREKELFYKAVKAYQEGDIATLQEIYDEVFRDGAEASDLQKMTQKDLLALRDRLKEKIARLQEEIARIHQEFPYREKAFLDDADAVRKRRAEMQEAIRRNEETLKRLSGILQETEEEMRAFRGRQKGF